MDITKFIIAQRDRALSIGDYGSYRKQLSRRLLVVRKKLNYTTLKGRKYSAKRPVTAEDIANNHEYYMMHILHVCQHADYQHCNSFVHLLLLTSERAWAQAMHMKSTHSADGANLITGSTKQHIGSRLNKASAYAEQLVNLLKDKETSKASAEAILEARAYYVSLLGAINFEKQHWAACLHSYSEARLIYAMLARSKSSKQEDLFKDILNSNIDPSIRYAAYQQKLPRTISIDSIVLRFVPRDNESIHEILKQNPEALDDPASASKKTASGSADNVPKTIQWRSRTVTLEDAATAQALAAVSAAEQSLTSFLSSNPSASSEAKGAAFDGVLIPSQDAVDAIKTAIDELFGEGIAQSDRRMQSLQITRTAVNYNLVGWRVGRNRILCGEHDGAVLEKHTNDGQPQESNGRKMKRLKERVVLYDSTLQSIDSVKILPGVAADQAFLDELEVKRCYFAALRCLAVARSHSLGERTKNALALLSRALDLTSSASRLIRPSEPESNKAPNLEVTSAQTKKLQKLLESLVFQHRALVELHNVSVLGTDGISIQEETLVERLETYPPGLVDLTKLVTYPPRLEPIPVKPIFLDVAFNYIDYPGQKRRGASQGTNGVVDGQTPKEEKKEGKKGWFGFGR